MKNIFKRVLAFALVAVMMFSATGSLVSAAGSASEYPKWKTVILNVFDFVLTVYNRFENDDFYDDEVDKAGVLGFLYDPKGMYFYTSEDPWQRNIGYNSIFDIAAPATLINFETHRLRFEYGDKDWMIQLWKGQYGMMFYGTEIGVYTKPKDRILMHYDAASDDEMLKMSLDFNVKYGDKWIKRFSRPYDKYWWCTGFLAGNKLDKFDEIKVDARITAKDKTMLKGIKSALKKNDISYTTSGRNIYFSF